MVEIGMPVKVLKPYKNGEIRNIEIRTKDATVVGIYKNFILVQYNCGYKECVRENELWYEGKIGGIYGYKSQN